MESNQNTPLEHQNVPAAHQGLHGFLYGADNEHQAQTSKTLESDGTAIVAVDRWQSETQDIKVAGVYAVLDRDRLYQYIGYSRDVSRSLKGHIAQNGQICAYIRVQTFKFPQRQAMETLKSTWLAHLDYTPEGNTDQGSGLWARTIGAAAKATMSAAEKDAYEDKKLKLRKAMADATLTDELTADADTASGKRHQKLEAAVKNDDWSSLIDG